MKSSARFTIAIGRSMGAVVVTVHGEFDAPSAAHLGSVLTDIINSQDGVNLIIDLHDVRDGDGDGLWVFATAAELAVARGGTLVLASPPDTIYPDLEAAGVAKLVSSDGDGRKRPGGTGSHSSGRWAHPTSDGSKRSLRGDEPQDPAS